jgi:hypothetical protein
MPPSPAPRHVATASRLHDMSRRNDFLIIRIYLELSRGKPIFVDTHVAIGHAQRRLIGI